MATSYTLLADLRVGRCSNTAKVHLLRVLEARNINKGGELMSVDMLLIDENMYELFIELTIQLRKWGYLSTPSRKRCDDVCVRPSVLNAPFQIPTGYFMNICFSDFMYLFFGLIQYFCSFDVEKHILLSLKSTKVFPNVIHKSACKEKPSTPPHPTDGRSSWWCLIYTVPLSDDYITHWKQQH
ncbi:hypothetical protein YC2023_120357 [Brassica napus]